MNIANGKKLARVLASEALMQERVNIGKGKAAALEAHASASANSTRMLAAALDARSGEAATSLRLAEQYVSAFKSIAQAGNTVVVPANAGDVGSMVAQAVAIYKGLDSKPRGVGAVASEVQLGIEEEDRADAPLLSTTALDSEAVGPSVDAETSEGASGAEHLDLDSSREGPPGASKPH